MELCPGEDESQLATTKGAVHDLQVVDSDLGFAFRVAGMEMREAVIVEEHDDGDPKEAADRRHGAIMPPAPAAGAKTKHFAYIPGMALILRGLQRRRMDEAIDLAIEGHSPFPDRAAFIDADALSAGQQAMRAADQGLSLALVAADGKTSVLTPDASFFPRTLPWRRSVTEFTF